MSAFLRYAALVASLLAVAQLYNLAARPNVGKHSDRIPQWSPPK